MIKPFDQVIYTENGVDYLATVLETNNLDNFVGKDGEPHIHLAFFKPVTTLVNGKPEERKVIGTQDQASLVQWRYDVVHTSHEFSEEAQKSGVTLATPGGEWRYRQKASATKKASE